MHSALFLTWLTVTVQGKSNAFLTAQKLCKEATKSTISCSQNFEKSQLRRKPQGALLLILFLKREG